jgi:MFS transporter, DHA1 family, multidrug resistance protein
MAVVRDLYSGRPAATVLSRLMLVVGVAPVLAPTLGSQVLRWTDWPGVFVALAVIGVLLIAVVARALPETLPPHRRRPAGARATARSYRSLLADSTFVGLVLLAGFSMSALLAYVAGAPFVLQEQFGLSAQQFGLVFAAGAVALIGSTQANVPLLRRFEPDQVLAAALVAGLVSAGVLAALAVTGTGGLAGVLVPLWAVLASVGLVMPNAPAVALSRHGERAGTAAALLGAVQFGVAALAAPAVGVLGNDSVAMAAVMAAAMALALGVLLTVVRPGLARTAGGPVAPGARHGQVATASA